jgi:hypothetical protein
MDFLHVQPDILLEQSYGCAAGNCSWLQEQRDSSIQEDEGITNCKIVSVTD